jgi:poly-gamma-glutamate synthesis protein (capsule biosynthesis protein)
MRQNIYIKESRRRRKSVNLAQLFFFSLLLSFFLLIVFLWVSEGRDFTSAVSYVIGRKDYVIYDSFTVSFDETVPEEYKSSAISSLEELEFNGKKRFKIQENGGDIQISREEKKKSQNIFSKDLIPVGHMYSLLDEVKKDALAEYSLFVINSSHKEYLQEDYDIQVSILKSYEDLISKLAESDKNIGLVSFSELDYRVKILEVDGKYYLDNTDGSVQIRFYALLSRKVDDFIISVLAKNIDGGDSGWEKEKLSKVNMSGVVAISRALASKIDKSGDYGYPAKEIGAFLADANLTHISNEVSFVPGCTTYTGMRFCSRPEYIKVLEDSGVDIVELTGNHNNDFGSQYSKESIELYKSLGMRYFGGGLNEEDASKILYEEVNGTTIAFVGYNYYDTIYRSLALAGSDRSGANSYSEEKMKKDINTAKETADIVILTFQFQECYSYPDSDVIYPICYQPLSNPDQRGVFRKAIDLGADIVVGTQAHQPQTYELYGDGVIFYGLGNLYFDQSMWIGTRQGIVLSHYFYKGKHIQTRVVPIYMDKDLIPRLATEEQGSLLMRLLKEARD